MSGVDLVPSVRVARPLAATRELARRTFRRPRTSGPVVIFMLVFAAELAFGLWMASRGFRWNDAMSRSASGLFVVHSADPKLANIGFVWPPLPTLVIALWSLLYPIWPAVVSSGAAAALTTAACAGATAALLVVTARRLGLSSKVGWGFALLVAANPMLFLYGSNGMPEGVATPFLTGAVCFLTLFWHSGERLWIAASGMALALGVATVYQSVVFGAALAVALGAGVLWSSEARVWTPRGRGRAVEGLGLLLLVPPLFVGLLWIALNAAITGNPLDFMFGDYGYGSFQRTDDYEGPILYVTGDTAGALALVGERVFPFLIPLVFVLILRVVDGRFWRVNTLSVTLLSLSVPLGMVVPMAVAGSPMGFLRYLVFPLFVAAGWGLYEIAISRRRGTAVALVLAGWLAAVPAALWVMADPGLAPEESIELRALAEGRDGIDTVKTAAPVAEYLEEHVLPTGRNVLFDSVAQGRLIAVQIRPAYADQLIVTSDRRFKDAIAHPGTHDVGYFLMPDPTTSPTAAVGREYPRLWDGRQPGFRLVQTLGFEDATRPADTSHFQTVLEKWRLYEVQAGARRLPSPNGGSGR